MARITVEDCLENESNRFALVKLAAKRAKQLLAGDAPVTSNVENRSVVTALREIADGRVKFKNLDLKASILAGESPSFDEIPTKIVSAAVSPANAKKSIGASGRSIGH
jgi:DNA-directed RNA polymerase subunit omega